MKKLQKKNLRLAGGKIQWHIYITLESRFKAYNSDAALMLNFTSICRWERREFAK